MHKLVGLFLLLHPQIKTPLTLYFFPSQLESQKNRAQSSSPMMWGSRALRMNGLLPAMGGGRGPGGLIVVSRRKPLKSPWKKYCIFSPPSSNHKKPSSTVVAHDVEIACVVHERASSGHGRR
jgi:hypothetical protein